MIAELLFKNAEEVWFIYEFPNKRLLDNKEIKILKASIEEGTELTTIPNGNMSYDFQSYLGFKIFNLGRRSVNIYYDKNSNYMIVSKIGVHKEREAEYQQKLSL